MVLAIVAFLLLGSAGAGFDPIAQAATISARAPGYRIHMTMEISSPALGSAMSMTTDGVVDLRDHASSMSMVMTLPPIPQVTQALGGDTLSIDVLVEHTVVYFKLPGALAAKLPYDKPWLKLDLGSLFNSAGLSGLSSLINNPMSSNPASELSYLRATSGDVTDLGPEVVDGVATTHYRAEVDFSRLPSLVPPAERAAVSQTVTRLEALTHTSQVPVDVWIDHGHLVRRMEMVYSFTPTGGQMVRESMTANLTDYGPQLRPAAPPADQVQDVTGATGF